MEFKRRRVLECARDLLFDRGYKSTTLLDIASDLKLNKMSLYAFYPKKRELLAAVCELGLIEVLGVLDEASQIRLPRDEKLKAVVHEVTTKIVEHRKSFVILQRDAECLTDPARGRLRVLCAKFDRGMEELVSRGHSSDSHGYNPQDLAAARTGLPLLWDGSGHSPNHMDTTESVESVVGFISQVASAASPKA